VHMQVASPAAHSLGERGTFLALGIIQHLSNNTLISYKGAAQCLLRYYCYLTAETPTMFIQLLLAIIRDVYFDVVIRQWSTTHNYTSHWPYDRSSTQPTIQTQC